jgi:hypothetical protein
VSFPYSSKATQVRWTGVRGSVVIVPSAGGFCSGLVISLSKKMHN